MARRMVLLALCLAVAAAVPASAHGAEGELVLVSATPTSGLSMRLDVQARYTGDGDPAEEATVTVTGKLPDGTAVGPERLAPAGESLPGRYSGTVAFPKEGTWNLTFSSASPTASLSVVQEVTGEAAPSTTTTASTLPTLPVRPVAEDEDDTDAGDVAVAVVVGAVAAVVVAGIVLGWRRRRQSGRSV